MKSVRTYLLVSCMLFCIGAVPASQEHDAWWNIYFTAPGAGRSGDNGRNPESGLVALIREAKTSVHGAFYGVRTGGGNGALRGERGVDVTRDRGHI